MPSDELIAHSVTRDDYEDDARSGGPGVFHVLIGDAGMFGQATPGLPHYWCRQRDWALAATLRMCSIWPSAVNKAITKQVALGWRVEDSEDSPRRTQAAQDVLTYADASDWVQFGFRHLQDVYLTDNGAFIEVVRASGARGARILGLMHLDSMRCTRTGYPEYPVLYQDDYGKEHPLRREDVLFYADMPSARAGMHGIGLCAADRAFEAILKIAAVETYFREKVSGSRALAIHIVSGVGRSKLDQAFKSADEDQREKGFVVYKGSVVVPVLDQEKPPGIVTIPLAEIPDGFDVKTERDAAYLELSNALGIPLQDIQPLSGQGLGTGTQTVILDEAAEGMGPGAAWRKWFEHMMTYRVAAKTTTFHFATNDIRDQKAKAEVAKLRAETRKAQIDSGEITPAQSLNMAVDAGDAPREFLADDQTHGGVLTDNEKPLGDATALPNQGPPPPPLAAPLVPIPSTEAA